MPLQVHIEAQVAEVQPDRRPAVRRELVFRERDPALAGSRPRTATRPAATIWGDLAGSISRSRRREVLVLDVPRPQRGGGDQRAGPGHRRPPAADAVGGRAQQRRGPTSTSARASRSSRSRSTRHRQRATRHLQPGAVPGYRRDPQGAPAHHQGRHGVPRHRAGSQFARAGSGDLHAPRTNCNVPINTRKLENRSRGAERRHRHARRPDHRRRDDGWSSGFPGLSRIPIIGGAVRQAAIEHRPATK